MESVEIKGIMANHDSSEGHRLGTTTIYVFQVDGVRFCHLGDLGEPLSQSQLQEIGEVDVLMIPVGGNFTLDGKDARKVTARLKPKVAIPMHYRTAYLDNVEFPLDNLDKFLEGQPEVRQIRESRIEITKQNLPEPTEIWVMNHTF